jgi:hypothetical protein
MSFGVVAHDSRPVTLTSAATQVTVAPERTAHNPGLVRP